MNSARSRPNDAAPTHGFEASAVKPKQLRRRVRVVIFRACCYAPAVADIFISYAREDKERAEAIATALINEGWTVWWDRQIRIGRRFSRAIEGELASARCVVVIWSRHSVNSDWVLTEAAEGVRRHVLVPVKIDEARIPLEFRGLQTADLTGWPSESFEFAQCVASIAELVPPVRRGADARSFHARTDEGGAAKRPARRMLLLTGVAMAAIILTVILGLTLSTKRFSGTSLPLSTAPTTSSSIMKATREASVIDKAGILGVREVGELEEAIAEVAQHSSAQIKIHIEPRIPTGQTAESAALAIAEKTFPSTEQKGIVIAVFVAQRQVQIRVARALVSVVTDEHALAIIRTIWCQLFAAARTVKA